MIIDKISVKNFRNIEEETSFQLNPHFTVLIGINGKGKSTILHAIRIACGAYFLAVPEVKKRHISQDEIRVKDLGKQLVQQKPVKVEAFGRFPGVSQEVVWRRQITEGSNSTTSNEKDIGIIRNLGRQKYESIVFRGDDKVDLPVIAFFGTSRAFGAGRNRRSRIGRQIFKEGYQDWFEMKSSTFRYEDWLSSYDILQKNKKEYPNTKKAFVDAIRKANPFIDQIEIIGGKIWMAVSMDDYKSEMLPIEYHSDGIRFFTEMVAELAYRCILLNGFNDKKAVENSKGIVMIDEIDLHLHPKWQRQVVSNLKKAFPNIQFVATTHSPFIVQSLNSNELINLDKDTDIPPKNLSINDIAENIMGLPSEMSEENTANEKLSFDYLRKLSDIEKGDKEDIIKQLEQIELTITDPAVRAFLKMKRLEKEH